MLKGGGRGRHGRGARGVRFRRRAGTNGSSSSPTTKPGRAFARCRSGSLTVTWWTLWIWRGGSSASPRSTTSFSSPSPSACRSWSPLLGETAWVRTGEARLSDRRRGSGARLFPDQLRARPGHRHRPGVPVRDVLEHLLAVRRRRVRGAARHRGAAGVLPGVRPSSGCGSSGWERADTRSCTVLCMWAGGGRLRRVGLLHPGRQLVHAVARRVPSTPAPGPR